jgi:hypothetical protein
VQNAGRAIGNRRISLASGDVTRELSLALRNAEEIALFLLEPDELAELRNARRNI